MTRLMVAVSMAAALLAQPTFAQFGIPKVPDAGGGLSGADIDTFVAAAKVANEKMTKTEAALAPLVLSKEEADAYKREMDAASATPNVAEREVQVQAVEKKYADKVKNANPDDPAVNARLAKASAEDKAKIKAAVENFLSAAGADVVLALQAKKLATQKPDLAAAAKAPALAEAVKDTVDQATAAVKVTGNVKRLVTTAKIDIPADSFAKVLNAGFP